MRILIVFDGALVVLEFELARGAAEQRLQVLRLDVERRIAVLNRRCDVGRLEVRRRAVGVQRQLEVDIVRLDSDGLGILLDGLGTCQ